MATRPSVGRQRGRVLGVGTSGRRPQRGRVPTAGRRGASPGRPGAYPPGALVPARRALGRPPAGRILRAHRRAKDRVGPRFARTRPALTPGPPVERVFAAGQGGKRSRLPPPDGDRPAIGSESAPNTRPTGSAGAIESRGHRSCPTGGCVRRRCAIGTHRAGTNGKGGRATSACAARQPAGHSPVTRGRPVPPCSTRRNRCSGRRRSSGPPICCGTCAAAVPRRPRSG